VLFGRCFEGWIAAQWPGRHDLIATGRPRGAPTTAARGSTLCTTLSAYASSARLTLAQLSVPEKTNEITAIPDLLDQLAAADQLKGALVTIDAMGARSPSPTRSWSTRSIICRRSGQPTPEGDVASYFADAPVSETVTKTTVEKGHGRIETRTYTASSNVSWIVPDRHYPGEPRFTNIKPVRRFALGLVPAKQRAALRSAAKTPVSEPCNRGRMRARLA
jgi:predicted transposase YbfD/YdcC